MVFSTTCTLKTGRSFTAEASAKGEQWIQAARDHQSAEISVADATARGNCKLADTNLQGYIDNKQVDPSKVFFWKQLVAGPNYQASDQKIRADVYIADYRDAAGKAVHAGHGSLQLRIGAGLD